MTPELFPHPSAGFLALALALLFVRESQHRYWRWLLLLAPIAAMASVALLGLRGSGDFASLYYLDQKLSLGRVDALTLVFASVFAIQSFIAFLYALHLRDRWQHIASSLYIAGAFICIFAGDYLTLFLGWELMSLSSVCIIWLGRSPSATAAGFRYFLMHVFGGVLLLGGLVARHAATGDFAFTAIAPASAHGYDYLILAGFLVNAAFVPLHAWLPDAYPEASITGAVFLSAFTTKTAVYVLARGFAGWQALAIGGCVMCLYGVCYATIENNARRILSYHIVSQVGYMVCGIGVGAAMTVDGACAHAFAHILYKGLLFMSVGCLLEAAGTAKLTELGGLAARLPWVMIAYMIGALSISGMPLFNGFISKTMTITGAAEAHHAWLALGMELAAVGTFLSVGLKLPYYAFWSKTTSARPLKNIPLNMYLAMGAASLLCLVIGLVPQALYRMLPYPVEYHPYTPWHVLQTCMLLAFTGLGFYLMRRTMRPHEGRNLDFDMLYRLIGRGFARAAQWPAAVDNVVTELYSRLGLRGLLGAARGANVVDQRVIDGMVDGAARMTREHIGAATARAQTGRLQDYIAAATALALVVFAIVWLAQ